MTDTATTEAAGRDRWLTKGTIGISGASLLADVGHEIPTSLLPSLLTSTLGAPAAALGVIEGVADDPPGGAPSRWAATPSPLCSLGLVGVAGSVWQVAILRAGAWTARCTSPKRPRPDGFPTCP